MSSTGDDGLIEFTHTVYDTAGNAAEEHQFELNHTDVNGIDIDATTSYVRASTYNWYDGADRLVATANYGSGDTTSGPGAWKYAAIPSRPGSAPNYSHTDVTSGLALLTTHAYSDAATGRWSMMTDPAQIKTKTFYDDLGRPTFVAENQNNFEGAGDEADIGGGTNNEQDRVTAWHYNGLGNVLKLIAYNGSSSAAQTTTYLYEDPYQAGLVTNTIYPDSSDTTAGGTDQVFVEYHLDGLVKKRKGQGTTEGARTIHEYTYNNRRQLELDKVTQVGTGIDSTILSLKRSYDTLGRLELVTSYAANNGSGTIHNEIKHTYHSTLAYLQKTEQSHQLAVTTGTPAVEYTHDESVTSSIYTNGLRRKMVTYPSGRKIHTNYGSAGTMGDVLGRVLTLHLDSAGSQGDEIVKYAHNGTARLVETDYTADSESVAVRLRMFSVDGGLSYIYNGFDRFGRTVAHEWRRYHSGSGIRSRVNYAYDSAGNRLTADIPSALYASDNFDSKYEYDGLHRLKDWQQGTLSGTTLNSRNFEQAWTLDQLGNWPEFKERDTDVGATWDLDQDRTHNAVNEITDVTVWADPAHDAAGNMTTIPQAAAPASTFTLKYDAWNRLVQVNAGLTLIQTNEYDGLGQRIRKDLPDQTDDRDYYYNDQWQLLEERKNGDADPLNQFLWHPYYIDALAVRWYDANVDGSGIVDYYHLHDANYNVSAVVDNGGSVQERYKYSPYGQVTVLNADFSLDSVGGDGLSDIGNTHFYTGRERDPETGLQLNRNRFYAWHLGRWMTRDPILYRGGMNLYAYVYGRPTIETDPRGTDCPGCDLPPQLGADDSPCVTACCAEHDRCFHEHNCTYYSWGWNIGGGAVLGGFGAACTGGTGAVSGVYWGSWVSGLVSDCAGCNHDVAICIAACAAGNHMAGEEEYFCAGGPNGGQFITICPPNDPRAPCDYDDLDAAKRDCCTN